MKRNGHLIFQCIIDCWGARSNAGIPGAILLLCNVIATPEFSTHNCITNNQVEGKIKNFKLD